MVKEKKVKYIVLDIETTGLSPIDSRVTCIGAKTDTGHGFYHASKNESLLLQDFFHWFAKYFDDRVLLITKNGLCFDLPFLVTRASMLYLYLIDMSYICRFKQLDLHNVTKGRVKLDDMATLLGITNKSGNGLRAIELFHLGKLKELVKYCKMDVFITEKVYLNLKKKGVIK